MKIPSWVPEKELKKHCTDIRDYILSKLTPDEQVNWILDNISDHKDLVEYYKPFLEKAAKTLTKKNNSDDWNVLPQLWCIVNSEAHLRNVEIEGI